MKREHTLCFMRALGLDLRKVDHGFWKYQYAAAKAYLSIRVQLTVAGLIAGNFLANIVEKWVDPDGDRYPSVPLKPFNT